MFTSISYTVAYPTPNVIGMSVRETDLGTDWL
eukprot:CAMPEP_0182425880 /NCGR_PEP_ID=MMETSP1167-20130531/12377_1 /TAXON_ID=2988 /ORGANISM="Mallomonas Sp, Strain CCMP3275" /LENGTH=31 /DNA_ID= /DNA_START= /DNA_END= /DNA_ORIENTATION=